MPFGNSFETDLSIPALGTKSYHSIFIRAPIITSVGPSVTVLASLSDGTPVATLQNRILATAFHPELTDDPRFHQYFLKIVTDSCQRIKKLKDQTSKLLVFKHKNIKGHRILCPSSFSENEN